MVDTSNSTSSSSSSTNSNSNASFSKLASDFSSFLNLLTTQLRNQDPLNPLDTHEFTNQLVLFAGVEQSIRSNKHLEDISTSVRLGTLAEAQQLVGKQIKYSRGPHVFDSTGKMKIELESSISARSGFLRIFDNDKGTLVYQLPVPNGFTTGKNTVEWDGKIRSTNGTVVRTIEKGEFKIDVSSVQKTDGTAYKTGEIKVVTNRDGVIASVKYQDKKLYAVTKDDSEDVPFENISNISQVVAQDSANWADQLSGAASLIGSPIRYQLNSFELDKNGQELKFKVPGDVFSATVNITDLKSNILFKKTVQFSEKESKELVDQTYEWDGTANKLDSDGKIVYKKDSSGKDTSSPETEKLESGEYRFYISNLQAYSSDGKNLRTVDNNDAKIVYPERNDTVQGVDVIDGKVVLRMPKAYVPLTAVNGIDKKVADSNTKTDQSNTPSSFINNLFARGSDTNLQTPQTETINQDNSLLNRLRNSIDNPLLGVSRNSVSQLSSPSIGSPSVSSQSQALALLPPQTGTQYDNRDDDIDSVTRRVRERDNSDQSSRYSASSDIPVDLAASMASHTTLNGGFTNSRLAPAPTVSSHRPWGAGKASKNASQSLPKTHAETSSRWGNVLSSQRYMASNQEPVSSQTSSLATSLSGMVSHPLLNAQAGMALQGNSSSSSSSSDVQSQSSRKKFSA